MEATIYNQKGAETGKIKLPENIFGAKWKESLVHQVVTSMMGNKRTPIAHTKNRGDVAGSGIKPWRQKGTGKARHGSRRSPIWVGGGVSGGPRNEKNFKTKINKKMRTAALFSMISKKFKDGEVIFLDNLSFKNPKTKDAKEVITSLSKIKEMSALGRRNNAAFIALDKRDDNVLKSFNNFGNLEIGQVKDLNAVDLMQYRYLVITNPEKSIETLTSKLK
ncbi:MAG: 50S ribosomal protein L4 [Patescibacteria group bacterium]